LSKLTRIALLLLVLCPALRAQYVPSTLAAQHHGGGGGGGATNFAYVANSVSGCFQGSGGTKCVFAPHNTPAAGQLRNITIIWSDTGTQTILVTSSNGDVWNPIVPGKVTATGGGFSFERFTVLSSGGGADTITVAVNTGTALIGWETTSYTYTGTLSAVDGTPVLTNVTSSGSIATTSAVTTTGSSDLLWADCPGTQGTCTVGSGWTSRNDTVACSWNGATCNGTVNLQSAIGMLVEDKVGVTAGTYTATFGTTGATDTSVVGLAAF
jgi:hypothetical protein